MQQEICSRGRRRNKRKTISQEDSVDIGIMDYWIYGFLIKPHF